MLVYSSGIMVTVLRCWWHNHYVGDLFNVSNRAPLSEPFHQHRHQQSYNGCHQQCYQRILHTSPTSQPIFSLLTKISTLM